MTTSTLYGVDRRLAAAFGAGDSFVAQCVPAARALSIAWNSALKQPGHVYVIRRERDRETVLELQYENGRVACRAPGKRRGLTYTQASEVLEANQ
jgi:hypothetical protein